MKLQDAMICWLPSYWPSDRAGEVEVVVRGKERSSLGYASGACDVEWQTCDDEERVLRLFLLFHTLVVRDWVDPKRAHDAFLRIDEYRERISPDIEGAA